MFIVISTNSCFYLSRADKYSRLVSNQAAIRNFVGSVVNFLKEYGFDGLDMDWEYPRTEADKKGFTDLMKELHNALQQNGLVLSAAIPASQAIIETGTIQIILCFIRSHCVTLYLYSI